ncbi:MAG: 30S ribosomal protein S17 [Pseudomonadota bacterium]
MPKRVLQGVVVSNTNDKTVTVSVERRFTHPLLHKTMRSSKKYRAHDPMNACEVGQTVRIRECAPHSKSKRWEVLSETSTGA